MDCIWSDNHGQLKYGSDVPACHNDYGGYDDGGTAWIVQWHDCFLMLATGMMWTLSCCNIIDSYLKFGNVNFIVGLIASWILRDTDLVWDCDLGWNTLDFCIFLSYQIKGISFSSMKSIKLCFYDVFSHLLNHDTMTTFIRDQESVPWIGPLITRAVKWSTNLLLGRRIRMQTQRYPWDWEQHAHRSEAQKICHPSASISIIIKSNNQSLIFNKNGNLAI